MQIVINNIINKICSETKKTVKHGVIRVTALTTGSEAWWQAKDGPERERHQENYRVTFWWRDPAGTQKTSTVKRVWLYVTGVTDHHQNARPQSLERIPDTDVWQWQGEFNPEWRGSYCFIPSDNENDFASAVFEGDQPDRMALREGWRKLLPHAVSDPLNAQSWRGGRGHAVSALEMPEAPVQPGWNHPDTPYKKPVCIEWHSARLKNRRRVWIFTTGDESPERPLAVLLDGQFWAESMPVWPALASLTHEGKLPPAVYVLIDVIDTAHRSRELPCNPDFWLAVQDELLPQVKSMAPFSDRADHTVVAGQSFGGLSSSMRASTGRSVLAASSASPDPTGGRTAARSRTGCSSNNSKRVTKPLAGCASSLRPGATSRLFCAQTRRSSPNYTLSNRFSGVRLTADTMRFAGAVG